MGRSGGNKLRSNSGSQQVLRSYLVSGKSANSSLSSGSPSAAASKMATAIGSKSQDSDPITKADLVDIKNSIKDLKSDISEDLLNHLQPICEQLEEIRSIINQVASTADAALETAITSQQEIRQLQEESDWARDRIIALDNIQRQTQIKLKGLPINAEGNTNLVSFLSQWIASELNLEGGVLPVILNAYRTRASSRETSNGSRDIIVTLQDMRTKNAILNEARNRGIFKFQEYEVHVFPNISAEALSIRHALKPLTAKLNEAGIRYKWLITGHLQVIHQGKPMRAGNMMEGQDILYNLGLAKPSDLPETGQKKRRRESPTTPNRWNKVSNRHSSNSPLK